MKTIIRCIGALALALCAHAEAQTPCDNCVPATLAQPTYRSITQASYFYSGWLPTSEAVGAFLLSRWGAFYAHCSAVSLQGISPFTSNAWSGPTNNATKNDMATVTLAKGVGCGSPEGPDYPANTFSLPVQRWQTASCSPTFNISYPAGGDPVCVGPPKPKLVVIDPGHGIDCPASNMASGAIGATDFPQSNPPPGRMREDVLTMAVAQEVQRILNSNKVRVLLTKADVNSCPSFYDRGRVARRAKLLLSVHFDAPNRIPGQDFITSRNGSMAIYHRDRPTVKVLGDKAAAEVSSRLGLNNRGSVIDTRDLAILKPTVVNAPSVILEIARLSGTDEQIVHLPAARAAAAAGIKFAIESFLATQP
jgi:N-acetylmuramoyl-L-alanine amidase